MTDMKDNSIQVFNVNNNKKLVNVRRLKENNDNWRNLNQKLMNSGTLTLTSSDTQIMSLRWIKQRQPSSGLQLY